MKKRYAKGEEVVFSKRFKSFEPKAIKDILASTGAEKFAPATATASGAVAEAKKEEAPAKKQSFKEAFAAAREKMKDGGPKEFTWNGKSYTTALKGEASSSATPKAKRAPAKVLSEPSQPVGGANLHPNVSKYAKEIEEARKRGSANVSNPNSREARMAAASKRNWFGEDGSVIGYKSDKTRKAERAAIIAAGKKPNATPAEKRRSKYYEENPSAMKKGGKVKAKGYASGGSVKSASKRADGCAIRGKTRAR